MTTRFIIARHGNTFNKGETPTRVGARTDLPLVQSGLEQGQRLGKYLRDNNLWPDDVYAAPLKRTMQTAAAAGLENVKPYEGFKEIDYGPDENKPEDVVIARIGQAAIDAWNADGAVPNGWQVDVPAVIKTWVDFADSLKGSNKTTLVVSSNGIIRFAPYITGDFAAFAKDHEIKVGTGCLCVFEEQNDQWVCTAWNVKPPKEEA